jgi:hypothetical protein
MTGQCYHCAAGDHPECYSEKCTCCGPKNKAQNKAAARLAELIAADLRKGDSIRARVTSS